MILRKPLCVSDLLDAAVAARLPLQGVDPASTGGFGGQRHAIPRTLANRVFLASFRHFFFFRPFHSGFAARRSAGSPGLGSAGAQFRVCCNRPPGFAGDLCRGSASAGAGHAQPAARLERILFQDNHRELHRRRRWPGAQSPDPGRLRSTGRSGGSRSRELLEVSSGNL